MGEKVVDIRSKGMQCILKVDSYDCQNRDWCGPDSHDYDPTKQHKLKYLSLTTFKIFETKVQNFAFLVGVACLLERALGRRYCYTSSFQLIKLGQLGVQAPFQGLKL